MSQVTATVLERIQAQAGLRLLGAMAGDAIPLQDRLNETRKHLRFPRSDRPGRSRPGGCGRSEPVAEGARRVTDKIIAPMSQGAAEMTGER